MTGSSLILEHRWKLLATLLAAVLLAALGVRWWRGPQMVAETVVRRDFVQAVVASGHVETPHRVDIGAQITGTVVRVPVAVHREDAAVLLADRHVAIRTFGGNMDLGVGGKFLLDRVHRGFEEHAQRSGGQLFHTLD